MIEYINTQLNHWATWIKSGRAHLGYPGKASFVGAYCGTPGQQALINDEEGMAMSKAVNALDPSLKETVMCFYVTMTSCTATEIARHLCCSRDTVYERIHRAHVQIMGYLNDIATGVPVEPWRVIPGD